MKRVGNKGLTLLELLATILLLSIVMLCAQRLVNQLLYAKNNSVLAEENAINRALIIDTIQDDLVVYGLSYNSITVTKEGASQKISLGIPGKDKNVIITVAENSLHYTDYDGKESHWEYEGCTAGVDDISYYYESFHAYMFFQLHIPIYTKHSNNKKDNNNIADDIIITYYGKTESS